MTELPEGSPDPAEVRSSRTRGRALRWTLRSRLAGHPALYLPLARMKYHDSVLSDDTELMIDGFTRSAVTFATIAFQMAQRHPVRVAHTLHASGHIVAATRRGVPTLVAIRNPDDTALSTVIREPYVTLEAALSAHARFHTRIAPYRSRFVVGAFDAITRDFGEVIRQLNEQAGTSFDVFDHTDANVRECYEITDDRTRRPPWSDALGKLECGIIGIEEYRATVQSYRSRGDVPTAEVPEHRVQRPSVARASQKQRLQASLEDPRLAGTRTRAHRAYEAFVPP